MCLYVFYLSEILLSILYFLIVTLIFNDLCFVREDIEIERGEAVCLRLCFNGL